MRAEADNVLNHANYSGIDTTVNSPTFGQVTSVASMRKMISVRALQVLEQSGDMAMRMRRNQFVRKLLAVLLCCSMMAPQAALAQDRARVKAASPSR